ncbi:hypothetical protein Pcinc_013670 [Petrolisthes cinctipes]|uniref:Uncharacterized protein n=1 Tax=Petrolisthes cinctipes TaxID=88211 RepID=A0AAE1FY70_PETCI|nr:hypothetical protein Pcinc_013670 [Petrolisthes cinctipes]
MLDYPDKYVKSLFKKNYLNLNSEQYQGVICPTYLLQE